MTRQTGLRTVVVLAVAGVLLLDACGEGADDHEQSGGDGEVESQSARGEPAADPDDPNVVQPYVEDLLDDYDRVVNEIIADPGVAADRDEILVQEYLSLFEPNSQFAEDILDGWVANGEAGVALRPYDAEHPTNVSRLDGDIEVVSGDQVVVPTCVEQRYVEYAGGRVTGGVPYKEQPGEIVAVRVDGEWRLRRRDVFENVTQCESEGA